MCLRHHLLNVKVYANVDANADADVTCKQSLMVSTQCCYAGDPGSTPSQGRECSKGTGGDIEQCLQIITLPVQGVKLVLADDKSEQCVTTKMLIGFIQG